MKKAIICLVVIVTGIIAAACDPYHRVPDAPVIKLTRDSQGIILSWDPVEGAMEYYVYSRYAMAGETTADTASLKRTGITDSPSGARISPDYFIRFFAVRAGNRAGISGFSNVVRSE
jgi:hypothetical protein